jgi:hypothetical protein
VIRSGLRLRNVFDLPRTAHTGNDRGLRIISSCAIRCEPFGAVLTFGCPIRQSHAYAEPQSSADTVLTFAVQ